MYNKFKKSNQTLKIYFFVVDWFIYPRVKQGSQGPQGPQKLS